jgi:type I restriction-modification system DNA methylase subunit
LSQNSILVRNNRLILEHIIDNENVAKFVEYLNQKDIRLGLEDLIAFFEFVVSPQEKEVNGAVYTPEYIREHIVSRVLSQLDGPLSEKKFADIACGCGGFLITLARHLHKAGIPYREIFANCLYGVDIAEYSIDRTRLMLTLLALEDEDDEAYQFNLVHANSLIFKWEGVDEVRQHGGFDAIVGNPPYVGASKIDEESKTLIKLWEVSKTGKADMYIPFFQIGIENLMPNGIFGYITVNNFYRSVNGRALRHYFAHRRYEVSIVDFGAEQIFQGRSTYTCLCFVRNVDDGAVYYTKCESDRLRELQEENFERFDYNNLEGQDSWSLLPNREQDFISRIREAGIPLEKYATIRNGFATLRNDVYLFVPTREDERYYYFDSEDGEVQVEREICRNAVKGNILRCEEDFETNIEKLIFPYRTVERNVVLPIEEDVMRMCYPCAYRYLENKRGVLNERSKSDKIKPWYLYGRSQALNVTGYKLLFPYIADNPYFILSEDRDLMFYNGYCILDESLEKLRFLQKLLSTRLFWHYIEVTSKPYGGNFYALAKNYVKTFGVAKMTEEQKQRFMAMTEDEAERFVEELYGVE